MQVVKTISLDEELLKDIDEHIVDNVFQDRSSYIRYLAERDLYKRKIDKHSVLLVFVLLEMSIITMLLLLKVI